MKLTTKEIMEIIPHRQPFLLIDRVEEIVEGEKPAYAVVCALARGQPLFFRDGRVRKDY